MINQLLNGKLQKKYLDKIKFLASKDQTTPAYFEMHRHHLDNCVAHRGAFHNFATFSENDYGSHFVKRLIETLVTNYESK